MDGDANLPPGSSGHAHRPELSLEAASSSGVPSSEQVLARDESRCLSCGAPAEALVVERGGKIYQRVRCGAHDETEHLILSDSRLHHKLEEWNARIFPPTSSLPDVDDEDDKAPLLAVIDLTNRCNLRCPVCFADVTSDSGYYPGPRDRTGDAAQPWRIAPPSPAVTSSSRAASPRCTRSSSRS